MGSTFYQFIAVLCVNLGTIGYAISVGWMGIQFMTYDSDDCPLPTGRISKGELGWVASILGIGGLAGTIISGWMADRIGRKYSLLAMAIPEIVCYLLIIFAQNVYYLYASRFLSGFVGGAIFVVVPLMVAEIAEDSIRGTLSTILVVASSGGALIGFTIGNLLPYELGPWLSLVFPFAFLGTYVFMPETPNYLMKSNRMEDAEKSLRFYRNVSPRGSTKSFKLFEHELSKLKYAYTEMQRIDSNPMTNSPLKISDFINRPFAICCILMFAHEVCGVFTMVCGVFTEYFNYYITPLFVIALTIVYSLYSHLQVNFAAVIFEEAGSSMNPGDAAMIVGAIQFVGSYTSSLLIDRLGRKILMVVSFAGTAICHAILATYVYVGDETSIDVTPFNWLPVVAFSTMIFIAACGAMPIPYVLLGEILPDKIRNLGITVVSCISWTLTFILVKIFPILQIAIHLWGCIYLFSFCCIASVIYILIAVPETKGKSLDEILLILKVK